MQNLGLKLEHYWEEIRYKKKMENPNSKDAVEDTMFVLYYHSQHPIAKFQLWHVWTNAVVIPVFESLQRAAWSELGSVWQLPKMAQTSWRCWLQETTRPVVLPFEPWSSVPVNAVRLRTLLQSSHDDKTANCPTCTYRNCKVEEDPEHMEDEQPYRKTYKQQWVRPTNNSVPQTLFYMQFDWREKHQSRSGGLSVCQSASGFRVTHTALSN